MPISGRKQKDKRSLLSNGKIIPSLNTNHLPPNPLLDQLTTGVLLLNEEWKIRMCNSKASGILGIPGNGLINQHFPTMIQSAVQEDGRPYLFPSLQFPMNVSEQETYTPVIGIPKAGGDVTWISVIFSSLPED